MSVIQGEAIKMQDGRMEVPAHPVIPFIEGDGTGPDIWRASVRVFDAAVDKAYGGKRRIAWHGGARRTEGVRPRPGTGCRTRRSSAFRTLPRRHQGTAHDARRRRHPLAQRGAAADPRSLRVPAPGALVQGRALAGQAPREGRHGDLPREHRGHLRRHRVRRRHRRGEEGARRSSKDASRRPTRRSAFPRRSALGLKPVSQEGSERLIRAAIEYAVAPQAQERHPGSQGQHHEVHRGCVPQLGLRARRARVRRSGLHLGAVGAHQGRAAARSAANAEQKAALAAGRCS